MTLYPSFCKVSANAQCLGCLWKWKLVLQPVFLKPAALLEHQETSSEILFVIYMHRISSCSWWVGESLVGFIRPWPPTHTWAVCNRVWSSWNESPHLTCSARKWSEKSLLWFESELLPQVNELGFGACASLRGASDLTDYGDLLCSTGIRTSRLLV